MKSLSYLLSLALVLGLASCVTPAVPKDYGTAGNAAVKTLLTPNDPNLPYPIYAGYSEIESLFQQNDGRTYVINFWATWCRPCITEMPYFEQLAREKADKDLQVIMVSLDRPGDVRTKLKDFFKQRPMTLPVVALTDDNFRGWVRRVDAGWTTGSIPVTLVYRGGLRKFNRGQISSYSELEGLVRAVQ
ncbi:TlpA disulfide reductase family protein [Neolewinella persica]|uniref:TlpA disulfide reductase family protein n=1 Tax=Neolewinella persica TaxID=70998 RepID=UPI00037EBDFA|nr:TlpA disulfide reductase family protein [Neolewinella persica]